MAVRQGSSPSLYNMETVKCELFVQASQSRNGPLTWEKQTNSSVCLCLLSTEQCVFFVTWNHWLYEITLIGKGVKRLTISAFLAGARGGMHRKQQGTQQTENSTFLPPPVGQIWISMIISSTSHTGSRRFSIFFFSAGTSLNKGEKSFERQRLTEPRFGLIFKSDHQVTQVGNVVNCSTIVWLWMPDRAFLHKTDLTWGQNKALQNVSTI